MSLFGGAECSTSRNPLSQFTKHTGEDRSLQRPGLPQQFSQQGIREEQRMDQYDEQRLRTFMTPQDSFTFQPMHHELAQIPHQNSHTHKHHVLGKAWASELKSGVLEAQHSGSKWGAEFQSNSPISGTINTVAGNSSSNPAFQQNRQVPLLNSRLGSGGFQPIFSNYSARMNSGVQPLQTNSKVADLGNQEQWEDRFKEIDQSLQEFTRQEGKQAEDSEIEQKEPDIVVDDKYQANFEEIWESLHEQTDEFTSAEPSWEKDFATYAQARANFGQYKFEQSNQFLHSTNAYEIGVMLMEQGAKLSEAALAFEAAIQETPNHVDAWLKLGEVQTQNEKEIAGLTALEKCLALEPENLNALMTLAVSYINEGYDNAAFATLERWIETKYPQITDKARTTNPKINDEDRYSLHKRVTELFLQAAQLSPTGANIDADVQMGLGVLFYANEDFQKTIDCFKAALSVRPDDALLWNRLGASLANSNRSEEAIEAYYRALQLKPSFVRARYNLGVSSINIGCYKEAAEHLLGALSMHNVEGVDPDNLKNYASIANQSTSILETLKRAFIAMDRRDLLEKVRPGMDLNQFRNEFNF